MDPYTWYLIAMMVISLAVSYAMRPKATHAPPPSLEEFTVPICEEGVDIKVLFGTCWDEGPNVLDYGNLRNFPPIKADGGK